MCTEYQYTMKTVVQFSEKAIVIWCPDGQKATTDQATTTSNVFPVATSEKITC